jgi:hypothetical protein
MTVFQGQKFPYGVYNSLLSNHDLVRKYSQFISALM